VKPLVWSLASLLLLLACAHAQDAATGRVRILIYGADTVSECAGPLKALQAELPTLRFPDGWTVAIVCNPVAWQRILRIADPPRTSRAFSNLLLRSTVLNSDIFKDLRSHYRHTLAHELGHALCHCENEARAEQFALKHDAFDRAMAKVSVGVKGLQ
jgi:hypothetical protein